MGEEQYLPMEAIGASRIGNFIMGKVNNWREKRQAKQQEPESSITKIPWWLNPTDAAVISMGQTQMQQLETKAKEKSPLTFEQWLFDSTKDSFGDQVQNIIGTGTPVVQLIAGKSSESNFTVPNIKKQALAIALKSKPEQSKLIKGKDESGRNYVQWIINSDKEGNYNWKQLNGNYQVHAEKENKAERSFIKTNPKKVQEELLANNFDLGKYGADGKWGNVSEAAWQQAKQQGYTLENGKLIKKTRNFIQRAANDPGEHTLGAFTVRQYDDGSYEIMDTYDFNKSGTERSKQAIQNNTAADKGYETIRYYVGTLTEDKNFPIKWTISNDEVNKWRSDYETLHKSKN